MVKTETIGLFFQIAVLAGALLATAIFARKYKTDPTAQ
jgi:hypothetical protein